MASHHSTQCTLGEEDTVDDEYHSKDESIVAHSELCTLIDQRCFYIHGPSRSCHWEPPWFRWKCSLGLPYGWEQAIDEQGRLYYLDHLHCISTYRDPRRPHIQNGLRRIKLERDEIIGYGFVAAGHNCVIVQFVSPGGPSDGLLFPNDRIVCVNGENVENDTKDVVVEKVRASKKNITLDVEQISLYTDGQRRNGRVRFTDKISVSSPDSPINQFPSSIPNVLRIFLENGQTRSFKYDGSTTVQNLCSTICDKLQLKCRHHYSLAIEYSIGNRSSRMTLLEGRLTLQELASSYSSSNTRCVFRFAFIPSDTYSLYIEDPRSFEYFYCQCVNDVVCGRFAFEMRYEACIRLAALHMQQLSIDTRLLKEGRVSLSIMEKELGLATFLPTILLENVKRKEIRKHIRFYMKKDRGNGLSIGCTPIVCNPVDEPSQSSFGSSSIDSSILIRLKYIQILSHLPSFGCRTFCVTFRDSQVDMFMQVENRSGIIVRNSGKRSNGSVHPSISLSFQILSSLSIQRETETLSILTIRLNNDTHQGLNFIVEKSELSELIVYIQGYYNLLIGHPLHCEYITDREDDNGLPIQPPPYISVHTVFPSGWNYSADASPGEKIFDLRQNLPSYELASTFTQSPSFNSQKEEISSSEMNDSLSNSIERMDKPKSLLKATNSLLIKNSRLLHAQEYTSPLLKRPNNPDGLIGMITSDSSDNEESWSETLSQPVKESDLSFGLSSPDIFNSTLTFDSLLKHSNNGITLESLLLLFPDTMCTDKDIIDLTTPTENLITPIPSRSIKDEHHLLSHSEKEEEDSSSIPSYFLLRSETFPSSNQETSMKSEDIKDFLHRSNSICDDDDDNEISSRLMNKQTNVRRMSLKEFTGLDPRPRDFNLSLWKDGTSHNSLLSSFSARRRGNLSYDIPSPNIPIQSNEILKESIDIVAIIAKLESLRLLLGEEKEKEKEGIKDEDKQLLIDFTRNLSLNCKILIRDCSLNGNLNQSHIQSIIDNCEKVVEYSIKCISHMNTVFHSQLLTTKVDQVLSCICVTIPSLMNSSKEDSLHNSTSLAASLSQLMQTLSSL